MWKWLAALLVVGGLLGLNGYLLSRIQSLEQKLEAAEAVTQQLRRSTQGAFDSLSSSVNANDADLRDRLDVRFGKVDGKARQIEGAVSQIEAKVRETSGLMFWASLGNVRQVKQELLGGAEVNATGKNGYTPLHAAAENGHTEVVRLLLEEGADKSAQLTSGETPLALARAAKYEGVVKLLEGK